MFPLHIRRIAFPTLQPTRSQSNLIVRAINGWGDPEQLTDGEAGELKTLCGRWFGVPQHQQLQARAWRDAVVFSTRDKPSVEYAIIKMHETEGEEEESEDPVVLYEVNRGHRLIPADFVGTRYLEHVVWTAVAEEGRVV